MAKPFSIQSPEDIAKEYGGNKQKIGEAMQMGIVDPTAGVLAGMFIDRMRAAQMQEQVPQQTVAQQVMGTPAPAPAQIPPAPQPGAPAGLGAIAPQGGAPMPAPEMAPPQEAPMGMAMGGLAALPVPDDMFDEPDMGGYAGGGIVAFADGGPALGSWFEETALKAVPGVVVTSRQRSAAKNAQVGGVKNSYHLTDNARDFVPPKGMDMGSLAAKLKSTFGAGYDIINEGDHVHVEPGPKRSSRNASAKAGTPAKQDNDSNPGSSSAQMPNILGLADQFRTALTSNASPETKRRDEIIAQIEANMSPEARKKQSEQDKWEALAKFGFGLASTKSPNFLQAVGEAASETLPELRESRAARSAAARADQEALLALENKSNAEKREIEVLALELAKAQAGLLSDERKMDLQYRIAQLDDSTKRALAAMANYTDVYKTAYSKGMDYRISRADNAAAVEAARLRGAGQVDPSTGLPSPAGTGAGAPQVVDVNYGPM